MNPKASAQPQTKMVTAPTTPFECFLCGLEDATRIKHTESHLGVAKCHEAQLRRLKNGGQGGCRCSLRSAKDLREAEVAEIHENIWTCLKRKKLKKVFVNLVEVPIFKKSPDSDENSAQGYQTSVSQTSTRSIQGPPVVPRQVLIEWQENSSDNPSPNYSTKFRSIRQESQRIEAFESDLSSTIWRSDNEANTGKENSVSSSDPPVVKATKSLNPEVCPRQPLASLPRNGSQAKSRRKGIPQRTDSLQEAPGLILGVAKIYVFDDAEIIQ